MLRPPALSSNQHQPASPSRAVFLWFYGSVILWLCFCSSVFLWFCGSMILLFCHSVFLWFCSSMVLLFCGSAFCVSLVLWFCGSVFSVLWFCVSVVMSFCRSVFCGSVVLWFCVSVVLLVVSRPAQRDPCVGSPLPCFVKLSLIFHPQRPAPTLCHGGGMSWFISR